MEDWEAVYYMQTIPSLSTEFSDILPEILRPERSETPSTFWRKILQTAKGPFTVPINYQIQQHIQNACSMTRPFSRLKDMKSVAQIHNAAPTSFFCTALAATISSQLRRDHAGFATVSTGRCQLSPSSQDCVGACLTLIPCIVANVSSSNSAQVLQATHRHMSLAAEHERVDIRALARDTGENPLFNIVVNYRKFSKTEHGLSAPSSGFQTLTSRDLWDFDIVFGVEEIDDELVICLQWYEGRLQRDQAECWLSALHATLDSFVKDLLPVDESR